MCSHKINYEDLLAMAGPALRIHPNGYEQINARAKDWGSYQETYFRHNHLGVHEITTDFEEACDISVQDPGLSDSVHICFPLHSTVSANYHSQRVVTELSPGRFYHVYVPDTGYEWMRLKKVRLVNIKIERQYFTNLLSDTDPWCAALGEKLQRKEIAKSGDGVNCAAMQQVIQDILYTSLSGHLQKIFIEAKVLELIVLYLNHARCERNEFRVPYRVKKKDSEILRALHADLADNFRQDHSLRQLSRVYGLNEFTLKKGFKMLYGKTIFDYLFELKMNHARHLLLEEGKLVREASREIGYRNPNHFSTAFKKKFGINPMLLRNN